MGDLLSSYFLALIFGIIISCILDLLLNESDNGGELSVRIIITSVIITIFYGIAFLCSL